MTARTRSLFANLVDGQTYQVSTSPGPSGQLQWNAFRYESLDLASLGRFAAAWNQIATRLTDRLLDGEYRASALAWLAEVTGLDPNATDYVLILPDGAERSRPHEEP